MTEPSPISRWKSVEVWTGRPTELRPGQVWRLSMEVVIVVLYKRGDVWLVTGFACGSDGAIVFYDNRLMAEDEILENEAAECKGLLSEM